MSLRAPRPALATLLTLALSAALVIFIARKSVGGVVAVVVVAAWTRFAGLARFAGRGRAARRLDRPG